MAWIGLVTHTKHGMKTFPKLVFDFSTLLNRNFQAKNGEQLKKNRPNYSKITNPDKFKAKINGKKIWENPKNQPK